MLFPDIARIHTGESQLAYDTWQRTHYNDKRSYLDEIPNKTIHN